MEKEPSVFKTLWETTNEAYLIINPEGVILDHNPAAADLFSQSIPTSLSEELMEPHQIQSLLSELSHSPRTYRESSVTLKVNKESTVVVSLQISPILSADSEEADSFLVSLTRESTELEQLETVARINDERIGALREKLELVSRALLDKTLQLAEQKNEILTIINGMGDGLIGCDYQGVIIQYNDTARRLLQLPKQELTGHLLTEVCPEFTEAIHFNAGKSELRSHQEMNIRYREKEIRVSASPIFDEGNTVAGTVLILQDWTKQAEVERLKADLISIVSHELRSPLTSIKGYIDLLRAGDLGEVPEFMQSYMTIIANNANRLASLIDDMLDLTRIESGKLTMTFGIVDIKYLCDYVYLTLKPLAEQKNLSLTLEMEHRASVSGDMDRLQQALTNLVSNAVKYTPEGGKVVIHAACRNGTVTISVQDTGIGISEDDLPRLFQKFFRVKNEQTRNIGGTGLGLCIAKSIIEAHEGKIHIESCVGKGSTFTIELPEFHS